MRINLNDDCRSCYFEPDGSQIKGLDMAVRNGNDAISMLQTVDGALIAVTQMLREYWLYNYDANSATDRAALDVNCRSIKS